MAETSKSQIFDILVFSAHPDDAEFAMGGTLVKFSRAGYRLLHISLTKGDMGTEGDVPTRMQEFARASEIISCAHEALEFMDTAVENNRESRLLLAKRIRQHKPKLVFAPYHTNPVGELGGVCNVDHYTTGALVRDAVKMARLAKTVPDVPRHQIQKLYFYMLPSQVQPTLVVDVTEEMDQAAEAMMAHGTQIAHVAFGLTVKERLMTRRAALGLDIGVKYAEGFVTDMKLIPQARHFFEL